jgi:hypothetical protein
MLAMLGFGLFAIVVTFGTPDSSLIAPEAKIPLPFANSKIAFFGFLIAAPALLVVLTIYLHIFDTSRRELENAYRVSSVPTLFTLDHHLPRLLTYLIFYWLVPIVLAALTWKALARLWWGLPLLAVTIAVTGGLVWMQIRRRPSNRRFRKNLPLWVLLIGLGSVACFAAWEAYTGLVGPEAWHQDAFRRGLNLFRADLAEKWLVRADLRNADLEPSTDELVAFLVKLACDDSEGHIAYGMAQRAVHYSQIEGRRQYGKLLAKALLEENCEGVKTLTEQMRARLQDLVSATE